MATLRDERGVLRRPAVYPTEADGKSPANNGPFAAIKGQCGLQLALG
ncbi:MAG: hypothetical protein IT424_05405 [Pirellulales bacterium]|nr:hypothetical protein [Pirellulales bacterium]